VDLFLFLADQFLKEGVKKDVVNRRETLIFALLSRENRLSSGAVGLLLRRKRLKTRDKRPKTRERQF
jgi:hypothetical protein